MPNQIIISDILIPVDQDNRIKLNALHLASGAPEHKKPSEWLRRKETKELLAEFESQSVDLRFGVKVVRGGNRSGTFAHKLLAISYAGWISPKFQLEVNRVFLQSKTQAELPTPKPLNYQLDHNITLNELIFEIAQLRGTSPDKVRIHYSDVFGSSTWTGESEFFAALARNVLRRDLEAEYASKQPEAISLALMAKEQGMMLVPEDDLYSLQFFIQQQQESIEKIIGAAMSASKGNRRLLSHRIWG